MLLAPLETWHAGFVCASSLPRSLQSCSERWKASHRTRAATPAARRRAGHAADAGAARSRRLLARRDRRPRRPQHTARDRAFERATGRRSPRRWRPRPSPPTIAYTITAEDAAAPLTPAIPEDMMEKAKLKRLDYTSMLEMLGGALPRVASAAEDVSTPRHGSSRAIRSWCRTSDRFDRRSQTGSRHRRARVEAATRR